MSATFQSRKCLVLNKNWTPVGTVTLQRAITMLFKEEGDGAPKAKIIDPASYQAFTWEDWSKLQPEMTDDKIAGTNVFFKVPEIILLSKYEKLPRPKIHFSRRTLWKRDKKTCQYCGVKPEDDQISIDHVNPRAQGGLTTWENCVLCCVKCNRKKADRTPSQAGMRLLSTPKKPDTNLFKYDTVVPIESWRAFLGAAYMNVELENDNKN